MVINYKDLACPVVTSKNEADFRNVIKHSIANGYGANIIFPLGTTGEFYVLPMSDKRDLIRIAADEVVKYHDITFRNPLSGVILNKRLELAVGVTGNNLDETVELAQCAKEAGADYAVIMPVYITRNRKGGFTRRGVTGNVEEALKKAKGIDWILYDHPGMTGGKSIKTATWKKLAVNSRVKAIKASAADEIRIRNYRNGAHGNAKVYVGDEILGLSVESEGIVSGFSGVLPVAWSKATRGQYSTNGHQSHVIGLKLERFQKVYAENPVGAFKYMLKKLGVISSDEMFDSELVPSNELKRNLDQLMKEQDFLEMFSWKKEAMSRQG